eukprot:4674774-Pyramimonas_sp.AAC.1
MALAAAVWDSWMPLSIPSGGLEEAWGRLSQQPSPWQSIRSPFSASVASALRPGISMKGLQWHHPSIGDFSPVDLSPRTLALVLGRVVQCWISKRVADHLECPEFQNGVILFPLLKDARSKEVSPPGSAYLRSVVTGGQWPQPRQLGATLSSQNLCLACNEAPGALSHRHVSCQFQEKACGSSPPSFAGRLARACSDELPRLLAERLLMSMP